jgi:hypothetical protein
MPKTYPALSLNIFARDNIGCIFYHNQDFIMMIKHYFNGWIPETKVWVLAYKKF